MKVQLLLPCIFADHMPDGAAIDVQAVSPWFAGSTVQQFMVNPYEKVILESLGYPIKKGDVLPIANCLYVDTQAEHQVCVQPVHLEASHDDARLLPAECLSLTTEESESLVATLNELWNPDSIYVTAHSEIDWQLTGQDATALDCLPPALLAYRSMADALPRSIDAAQWRQLLTEAQMLLHEHPVNISRQQRGLRSVNSIWCFGGAVFSKPTSASRVSLYSDDSFTQGLASLLTINCMPLAGTDIATTIEQTTQAQHDSASELLIVDTRLQQAWLANDYDRFIDAREDIIEKVLQPINAVQQHTKHSNVHIDDCHGNRYESKQATGLSATLKRVFSKWR